MIRLLNKIYERIACVELSVANLQIQKSRLNYGDIVRAANKEGIDLLPLKLNVNL